MSALENTVSIFCASKLICGSKDQSRRSIDLEAQKNTLMGCF